MKIKIYTACFLFVFMGVANGALARDGDGMWGGVEPKKMIAHSPQSVVPLGVGDDLPFGTLRSTDGKAVDFEGLVRGKSTFILFYQGGWSPFANEQLEQLAGIEPRLARLGFQVLAVSPDEPAKLQETEDRDHLNFPLFCDRIMDVTRRFGLAFQINPKTLRRAGIHLREYTGNTLYVLPVPAIYGISSQGIIRCAFFDTDYPLCVEPLRLLDAAEGIISEETEN